MRRIPPVTSLNVRAISEELSRQAAGILAAGETPTPAIGPGGDGEPWESDQLVSNGADLGAR